MRDQAPGDDRVLDLEGVHNFRDYGGYALAEGGRLKRGLLWRSGQHHGATDADLARIARLALRSVFDLRSLRERDSHPCRRPDAFAGTIHFMVDEGQRQAPHIESAAQAAVARQRDAASSRAAMIRNYGSIAFRPGLQEMMRRYLAELAEGKGASLINCMAGKDRTGIAVAVLHLAAGVHYDDILSDYLLTNTAGNVDARIAAGAETMQTVTGQVDEGALRVLMGVEAEYLHVAFAAMVQRHGSTDAYLREALGADDTLRGRLREALAEG